jgi:RNA polymerase sigma-70 factor (ECF subfamily)
MDSPGYNQQDGRLIARSLHRPEEFAGIFEGHFDAVHRYLARRAGRERADDLASQTFIVAFERRASFQAAQAAEAGARPWLLGIATNLLRNEWRSEQRLLETISKLAAAVTTAPGQPDTELVEADHQLAAAMATLDSDQRDVLLLHAWGELSYEEIAVALAVPVGTVRSRLSRARLHLRDRLSFTPSAVAAAGNEREESR